MGTEEKKVKKVKKVKLPKYTQEQEADEYRKGKQ